MGAYDTVTNEVAEYSACGPARVSTFSPSHRAKPELCAPCASDARGRGTLSANVRFALSTRMAGTSAAAPHVTGLAALILQLNRQVRGKPLPVARLRSLLALGATAGARPLLPNRHQLADKSQPIKQSDNSVWTELAGSGRADAKESLQKI